VPKEMDINNLYKINVTVRSLVCTAPVCSANIFYIIKMK